MPVARKCFASVPVFLAGTANMGPRARAQQSAASARAIPKTWDDQAIATLEVPLADPALALKTRRGTGYYKVPSLKGLWYREMFPHDGSCATLEDWFDPRRVSDDYVPTGFPGPQAVKTRAVGGHRFGLNLSSEDRRALIAFLKTL